MGVSLHSTTMGHTGQPRGPKSPLAVTDRVRPVVEWGLTSIVQFFGLFTYNRDLNSRYVLYGSSLTQVIKSSILWIFLSFWQTVRFYN